MRFENFASGMNTSPGWSESGESLYAKDIVDMRVDAEGFLKHRVPIIDPVDFGTDRGQIDGIVEAEGIVFFLDDGELHAKIQDEDEVRVLHKNTDLEGRLSVVSYGSFVVITSEGQDQGYWIDISNITDPSETDALRTISVNPLGFDKPDISDVDLNGVRLFIKNRNENLALNGGLIRNHWYAYRFSFINDQTTGIFAGVESKLSDPIIVSSEDTKLFTTSATDPPGLTAIHGIVISGSIKIPNDGQIDGIAVYRSPELGGVEDVLNPDTIRETKVYYPRGGNAAISKTGRQLTAPRVSTNTVPDDDSYNITKSEARRLAKVVEYKRIDILREGVFTKDIKLTGFAFTIGTDGIKFGEEAGADIDFASTYIVDDDDEDYESLITPQNADDFTFIDAFASSNGPGQDEDDESTYSKQWDDLRIFPFDRDNSRFPKTCKFITKFNDRIMAVCGNEMRYSDVRGIAPIQWAYPELNTLKSDRSIEFAIEYFGTLLYGNNSATHKLVGNTPINYHAQEISNTGAIGPFAISYLNNGIGFVSTSGCWITNGTEMIQVSSGFLDEYFESGGVIDGSVTQLPDNQILWSIRRRVLGQQGYDDTTFSLVSKSERRIWVRWNLFIRQAVTTNKQVFQVADGMTSVVDDEEIKWVVANQVEILESNTRVFAALENTQGFKEIQWTGINEVDDTIEWKWKSHDMYKRGETLAMTRKRTRWLGVAGYAANDVNVDFTVQEGQIKRVTQKTIVVTDNKGKPILVTIRDIGNNSSFSVDGVGEVHIRGFYLHDEILKRLY